MGDLVADRADVVVAPLSFTHERRYVGLFLKSTLQCSSKCIPLQYLHPLNPYYVDIAVDLIKMYSFIVSTSTTCFPSTGSHSSTSSVHRS